MQAMANWMISVTLASVCALRRILGAYQEARNLSPNRFFSKLVQRTRQVGVLPSGEHVAKAPVGCARVHHGDEERP
jgi:hypothetical protein